MATVKIMILVGPNSEQYPLGLFELDILPRAGEFIFCDIGDEPVVFEVKDLRHFINPNFPTQIWISPIDEKEFEEIKEASGIWSSQEADSNSHNDDDT